MKEEWKQIESYENLYEVSTKGRVKSFHKNRIILLKPYYNKSKYKSVILQKGIKRNHHPLHRLVMFAFNGSRPKGMHIGHIDGNKENNTISNLKWCTPLENSQDRSRHGMTCRGSKANRSKLTEEKVKNILKLKGKVSAAQLARDHGVASNSINQILNGHSWKHIPRKNNSGEKICPTCTQRIQPLTWDVSK